MENLQDMQGQEKRVEEQHNRNVIKCSSYNLYYDGYEMKQKLKMSSA